MWNETIDKNAKKSLDALRQELSAAEIESVVLRWKTALTTSQNVYGLSGFRTWTDEAIDGHISMSGLIDQNRITMFWPDNTHIGYAIVAIDDRNLDVLAACSLDPKTPWVVVDASEQIKAKIAEKAAEMKSEVPVDKNAIQAGPDRVLNRSAVLGAEPGMAPAAPPPVEPYPVAPIVPESVAPVVPVVEEVKSPVPVEPVEQSAAARRGRPRGAGGAFKKNTQTIKEAATSAA